MHPSGVRARRERVMVTPKVSETKRGSAHKPAAPAPAAPQR
jgi:hypothetical protein